MRALSVDYRLAREAPFPAAIEDAVKAYRWLLAQHVAPSRIVIAGDSAGGGLTLSTLLALKEKFYPVSANITQLDPACAGIPIITQAIDGHPTTALSNSSGFGGSNVSLIFSA